MRITTSQIYDRLNGQMGSLSVGADRLQTQISTGKKLVNPSDDAIAYLRLTGLKRVDADHKAATGNANLANMVLSQTDTTLGSVETELQRAQELAIAASNGTMNAENRAATAEALEAILDQLFVLANTRDARDQPVFGGASGDVAYVRDAGGTITAAGTGEPAAIPLSDGATVRASVPGSSVFGAGDDAGVNDMFATLSGLIGELRSGQPASQASMDGISASLATVGATRASVGARMVRVDMEIARLDELGLAREASRSSIEDTDIASAITELQKTLTILQATQASFGKLTSTNLFDYLR